MTAAIEKVCHWKEESKPAERMWVELFFMKTD